MKLAWTVIALLCIGGICRADGDDAKLTFEDETTSKKASDATTEGVGGRLGLVADVIGVKPLPSDNTGTGAVPLAVQDDPQTVQRIPQPLIPIRPGSDSRREPQPLVPILPGPGSGRQPSNIPPNGCACVVAGTCPSQKVNTDGVGIIDIRKPNRPPPGIRCRRDQVWCCPSSPPPVVPGPNNGGPPQQFFTACGQRREIPLQGFPMKFGQATFGEYPWVALVLGKANNYVGGGALIDERHILTVAHKVKEYPGGKGLKIRLGEWNALNDTEPFKSLERSIAGVWIHPRFNPDNLQNDISILRLSQPIRLGTLPHINSACLPAQSAQFVGKRCWVAGWGKDAFGPKGDYQYIEKEVDVPVMQADSCERNLRGTRLGQFFTLDRNSFLCAGGEEGKDACTGDGGFPMVCEEQGQFYVAGLVAWGIGCAEPGVPGVYVNVANYMNWILEQVRQP